ncbi:MAG TPA: hypothetical protein VGR55_08355 [Candidatus Acidoferrum sp.]|nr:hypothetical protein [Candidatus Acidoferrum sp.]
MDVSIFVETDESNAQRVRIERKAYQFAYGKPEKKFITTATYLAYKLDRADSEEFSRGNTREFPDSEDHKAGSYVMLFRDKNGEIMYRIEPGNVHN